MSGELLENDTKQQVTASRWREEASEGGENACVSTASRMEMEMESGTLGERHVTSKEPFDFVSADGHEQLHRSTEQTR